MVTVGSTYSQTKLSFWEDMRRRQILHGFFRNQTFVLPSDSERPIDYSVSDRSDIREVFTPAPTPCSWSSFSHEHRSMGVLYRSDNTLFGARVECFGTTSYRKRLLEWFEGCQWLMIFCVIMSPILNRDGSDYNIGSVLSRVPHKVWLMKTFKLRNEEGRSLLLLRDSVLRGASTTSPHTNLWLRRNTVLLPVILSKKFGVDVTEEHNRGWWPWGWVLKIILGQPQDLTFLRESTKTSHTRDWVQVSKVESIVVSLKVTPKSPSTCDKWRTMCETLNVSTPWHTHTHTHDVVCVCVCVCWCDL